ncbi:hypothetical protein DW654_08495 [Roseburia inulinivorans]|uniref:Uncharacterized protein n=1 Tax=Roseburia inulinivorans TaxID=360807 RepID=A0A3R6H1T8_9FIRM|nr:hypothetical protein [Roseburia inulinivorans]RHF84189.1 hypothetical protein DW654_08495 [Roseburia inulinivorans]
MRTGKKYYLNSNEVTIGKRQYGIEIADNPVVSKHHAMQSGGAIVLIVFFYCRRSRWHISIHFRLSGIQFDQYRWKEIEMVK